MISVVYRVQWLSSLCSTFTSLQKPRPKSSSRKKQKAHLSFKLTLSNRLSLALSMKKGWPWTANVVPHFWMLWVDEQSACFILFPGATYCLQNRSLLEHYIFCMGEVRRKKIDKFPLDAASRKFGPRLGTIHLLIQATSTSKIANPMGNGGMWGE